MKSLYVLVLVSFCQGLPVENRVAQLSAPTSIKVTVKDPPAFEISWDKIYSGDQNDPVVGYKVKVWEVKIIKSTNYGIFNGEVKPIEQPVDLISGPDGMPVEILTSAEETKATYHNVRLDVTYEIRIQAITKINEGPMSDPIRIKLDKE